MFLSVPIYFLSVPIQSYLILSVFICFHLFLSVSIYFYLFPSVFLSFFFSYLFIFGSTCYHLFLSASLHTKPCRCISFQDYYLTKFLYLLWAGILYRNITTYIHAYIFYYTHSFSYLFIIQIQSFQLNN